MIFVDLKKNSMILADFLLLGSVSLKRIWIRLTKMKRIQTDPDPKHWSKLYFCDQKYISL